MDESLRNILSDAVNPVNLREAGRSIAAWTEKGFLDGLEGWPKYVVALMLENQQLYIDRSLNTGDEPDAFRRLAIPVVRFMFDPRRLVAHDLVSVQPMYGPCSRVILSGGCEEVAAITRRLKTRWCPPDYQDLLRSDPDPEAEAVYADELAWSLSAEINREILTDLWNNDGTRLEADEYDGPDALIKHIGEVGDIIKRKAGENPNWLVTSPGLMRVLRGRDGFVPLESPDRSTAPYRAGTWDGKLCVEDPLFPSGRVLLGVKGGACRSAYLYCPYVPLYRLPAMCMNGDPGCGCGTLSALLSRYAKKLQRSGGKYYGSVLYRAVPRTLN